MNYYLKEIVDRPLYSTNGAKIAFEPVDGVYGILATDRADLVAELDKAIANRIGGVVKITDVEYQDAKKKSSSFNPSQFSLPKERESLGAIPSSELQKLRSQGLAAVVGGVDSAGNVVPSMNPVITSPASAQAQATSQKVEPLEVKQAFSVPRVGKASAAKKAAPANPPGKPAA